MSVVQMLSLESNRDAKAVKLMPFVASLSARMTSEHLRAAKTKSRTVPILMRGEGAQMEMEVENGREMVRRDRKSPQLL